ncbi:MAG: cytochrome P460 family protein [Deltaproteobacteria bacterium]|nr:cytochrome P460 family protein [Deltaproteobacteria bacterium]
MFKESGYNTAAGDYFWVKYAPDGTVLKEGTPKGCIGCHTEVAENDWLFTGNLRKTVKSGYDY